MFIDNSILIAPSQVQKKILKQFEKDSELLNIKFMTLDDLFSRLTFSFDQKAIYYLMTRYNYKYDIALTYINNLKAVKDISYKNERLNNLQKLKNELANQDLLIYDKYIEHLLKNKKVYFYGYDYIPKNILSLLKGIDFEIIKQKPIDRKFTIYEFNNLDDEVGFVFSEIIKLIKKNISLDKIKIIATNEYHYSLNLIAEAFNIPINLNHKTSIYNTNLAQKFFAEIKRDKEETLKALTSDNNIYNAIVNIVNKYSWTTSLLDVKDMLVYDFKHSYKRDAYFDPAVNVETMSNNIFSDDDYVFLLGFNEGVYPQVFLDEDFLSNELKAKLGIETSDEVNKIVKDSLISKISNIKNLTLSYKKKSPFSQFYPSILIDELSMKIIKNQAPSLLYSNKYNKIRLGKYLDALIKLNHRDKDLNLLYTTYPKINYLKYDNSFTGIDKGKLIDYIGPKLRLSYTSLNEYYECGFKYYLSNILKLNIYEDNFAIYIGNLFHYVLSVAFKNNFNFNKEVDNFINDNRELIPKEKFLLEKLIAELEFTIKTIETQNQLISYKDAIYEEKVIVNFNKEINITFSGVIDKVYYKTIGDETYLALVDYKTGRVDLGLENIIYGLNLQLPLYLYLAGNLDKFKNAKVYGFYLQPILVNEFKIDKDKDYEDVKASKMRLHGYSLINDNADIEFDLSKSDSKVIQSMRLKNDGDYYAYAKVLTTSEIEKVYQIAESKIHEGIDNILKANFPINPKLLEGEPISCRYCKYKDICFTSPKDDVRLKKYKDLSFLSGEEDEVD